MKHWRLEKTIKSDPAERERFSAVIELYTQDTTHSFQVKQWIDDYWTKPAIRWISQFALFKCMHPQCIFSTDDKDDMAMHLDSHLTFMDILCESSGSLDRKIRDEQKKFRDCCYCDLEANSNNELLEHIVVDHSQSIFQCKYCFYRSTEVDYIMVHYESFHSLEQREIYLCGETREFREEDREMLLTDSKYNMETIKCGQGMKERSIT